MQKIINTYASAILSSALHHITYIVGFCQVLIIGNKTVLRFVYSCVQNFASARGKSLHKVFIMLSGVPSCGFTPIKLKKAILATL